ncbi:MULTISPECIES: NAD(P)H:quinone oxidoreductase [unclassified Pseudoalteromonas]|uniref:NAD(P)H:quinone oxidoreductase n=1 Tax=unclassified Pseudoalteromonas TaxID=194690 RepID=UPI000B3CCC54|nr:MULTISPECIES: NAD(P)H:quinone oxidoreductase [unclassified Pseudoalteromonas]MDN3380620.1 NAD(P)H:quinone oxidoreductase [Pseudoalteromonas sp. APC 3893]MDN3389007.1 NAD(P)H:quinone oxidoreductase [Pseudoalteromonas sp. APC 4017]OUS68504.1 transcriptional regulator [Pseudoalteromonas sp. A601]
MQPTIIVLYHSSHGSVAAMAHEIADAIELQGGTALLRTFVVKNPEDIVISKEELISCHGLAFGTPTRFGMMASQAKTFWETTSDLWLKGQLIDKPACVFSSSSSMHGGNEATLLNLSLPLLHHGMMLMGVPYEVPELLATQSGGTPYGASHVAGSSNNAQLSKDEIKICQSVGQRLVKITRKLQ